MKKLALNSKRNKRNKPENKPENVTQSRTLSEQKEIASPKEVRQKRFVEAYVESNFNITEACRLVNIGRRTFYDWRETDTEFLKALKIAQEEKVEKIEDVLFEKALSGDTVSCLFFLKCQG